MSPDGTFTLVLQTDGNLVLVGPTVTWASGTAGSGATALAVQLDGNVVLYTASGAPVWASGTAGTGAVTLALSLAGALTVTSTAGTVVWGVAAPAVDSLSAGAVLRTGGALMSPDHRWRLDLQVDGNLVLYVLSRAGSNGLVLGAAPVWAAGTASASTARRPTLLVMQTDGNLVAYTETGTPVWATGTATGATRASRLTITGDGQVTLTAAPSLTPVWTTVTTGAALWSGQTLPAGAALSSPRRTWTLIMQTDGNLVRYDAQGVPRWSSGTSVPTGAPDAALVVQSDGNAVVYVGGGPRWSTGTADGRGVVLRVLDADSTTLADADSAVVWSDGLPNWVALAQCESSGNPRAVNPAGYYGLYQFDLGTWAAYGGVGNPVDATPAVQTRIAAALYAARGRQPWPVCGRYL